MFFYKVKNQECLTVSKELVINPSKQWSSNHKSIGNNSEHSLIAGNVPVTMLHSFHVITYFNPHSILLRSLKYLESKVFITPFYNYRH